MARDLSFWKSKEITHLENKEIYALLSSGQYVNGLELLPTNQILDDFRECFNDWKYNAQNYFEKENESFQLMIITQFVRCDCYSMSEFNMNRIIDIMLKYDCPLYDSAIDVRFES